MRPGRSAPLWAGPLVAALTFLGLPGAPAAQAAGWDGSPARSPGTGAAAEPTATVAVECQGEAGPYQRTVEAHLGLTADGRQSAADCAAIAAFQRKHGIEPAQGYAGLHTYRAVVWEQALAEGDGIRGCPDTDGVVVCVDKNRQILWVEDAGRVIFRPVPARTGMPGYGTRTGWFEIFQREKEFWSTQYEGPMPFAQFFSGGQALHASYRPIFEDPGSHGCINLRYDDAKALWNGLRIGDQVYVWGTRSGD
ncbi:L,D-transpeptidase [Streptomyces qinzhouensis]|uniref:L,D-transpeptidase n=1 Tax=Streptomyces qinzhouensis TaxID=2599401 RepID=A0A5B8JE49_9ACTN|nr:L,D-transpeptidase [Streptomyces qinzhouensis]QDY78211.1 L,D-transpeptidase [Streptomyces qinzhouensis]